MDSSLFVVNLRRNLPATTLPWVVAALRQDAIVWNSLLEEEFSAVALEQAGDRASNWSPAYLALTTLELSSLFDKLRQTPMKGIDNRLKRRAANVCEEYLSEERNTPAELSEAGLIALDLRERHRMSGAWDGVLEILKIKPTSFWYTPLACLLGMLAEPKEFMISILNHDLQGDQIDLAIHAYCSNPIPPDRQVQDLISISKGIDHQIAQKFLRRLHTQRRDIARQVAGKLLQSKKSTELSQTADHAREMDRDVFDHLKETLYEAENHQIAGEYRQLDPLLSEAWVISKRLQSKLAMKMAESAAQAGDRTSTLDAWRRAVEYAPNDPVNRAGLASVYIDANRLEDAAKLFSDSNDRQINEQEPFYQFVRAKYAARKGNLEDAKRAAGLALNGLQYQGKTDSGDMSFFADSDSNLRVLSQLADLLIELNMAKEASIAANSALARNPSDSNALSQLVRAKSVAGNHREAANFAHLVVSLEPDRIDLRDQLSKTLEAGRYWSEALIERQEWLDMLVNPDANDLQQFAQTALKAKEIKEAIKTSKQILDINHQNGNAHAILGEAYTIEGDAEVGLHHYRQATQLAPEIPEPWLAISNHQRSIGDIKESIETLKTARHAAPNHAEIHLALGEALLNTGDKDTAMTALNAAVELKPKSPEVSYRLGKKLYELGDKEDANKVIEPAYQISPGDNDLAQLHGQILMDLSEYRRALPVMIALVQKGPTDPETYFNLANALLSLNESPQDAIQAIHRGLEINSEHLIGKALLAEAQLQIGDFEESFENFRSLMESPLAQNNLWFPRLAIGMSKCAIQLDHPDTAIAVLKDAVEKHPQNNIILQSLSDAYRDANLKAEAFRVAKSVRDQAPDDVTQLVWYAEQALRLGEIQSAVEALERCTQFAPERSDLLLAYADALTQLEQLDRAEKVYIQIYKTPEPSTNILLQTSRALLEMDKPGAVISGIQHAMSRIEESAPELWIELAQAYQHIGDLDKAYDALERCSDIAPNDYRIHQSKAGLLLSLDRPQAAIACLEHAININPEVFTLHADLAMIYQKTGDMMSALTQAERAISIIPPYSEQSEYQSTGNPIEAMWSARCLAAELSRSMLDDKRALRALTDGFEQDNTADVNDITNSGYEPYCLLIELYLSQGNVSAADKVMQHTLQSLSNEGIKLADLSLDSLTSSSLPDSIALRLFAAHTRRTYQQGNDKDARASLNLGITRINELETTQRLDSQTKLAYGLAADELGFWDDAIRLAQDVRHINRYEALPHLLLARALVLRAEYHLLCEDMDVVIHNPGEAAVAVDSKRMFNEAIEAAQRSTHLDPGKALIKRWAARGNAIFQPIGKIASEIESLRQHPDDRAAWVAAYRRADDPAAAVLSAVETPEDRGELMQLALTFEEEDPNEALSLITRATDLQVHRLPGELAMLHYLSARIAQQLGEYEYASSAIQSALERWDDESRWHTRYAEIISVMGDHPGAIEHIQKAIILEPDHGDLYVSLGNAYLRHGEFNESIVALEQACTRDPDNSEIWLALVGAHRAKGDLEAAATCAERAITLAPQEIHPLLLRADISKQAGELEDAFNRVQAALRMDPHSIDAHLSIIDILETMGRSDEALLTIEDAIAHSEDPLPLKLARADVLWRTQDIKTATAALQELAQEYPGEVSVLIRLAEIMAESGDSEAAIQAAQNALRADLSTLDLVSQSRLHLLMSRLLRQKGQLDKAIHHSKNAIQCEPQLLEAHLELGRAHQERREHLEAMQAFEQAIKVAPTDPRPYYLAGMAMKESKDYQGAEGMLRRAVGIAPDDVHIHRQLGAVVALNLVHKHREEATTR